MNIPKSPLKFKTFSIEYEFRGRRYCAQLGATDWEDAEARFAALARTGLVDGEIMEEVEAAGLC